MKKYLSIFLYAILAGICIGLGGTVFLRVKDAFTGGNVVGALLFTVGLFTICTRGYNLFTGKACYLFDNKPSYLLTLLVIWIGNLLGCILLALVERATGICGDSGILSSPEDCFRYMHELPEKYPQLSIFDAEKNGE